MPSSNPKQIPVIVSILRTLDFKSVIDVGCGYGKYGFLLREYIDRFSYKLAIVGIDAQIEANAAKALTAIYDQVYEGNFLEMKIVSGLMYDLILMIDVIEHFTKEDGQKALELALQFGKKLLIATPVNPAQQHIAGKPYEEHLSKWSTKEFKGVGQWTDYSTEGQIIGILTR